MRYFLCNTESEDSKSSSLVLMVIGFCSELLIGITIDPVNTTRDHLSPISNSFSFAIFEFVLSHVERDIFSFCVTCTYVHLNILFTGLLFIFLNMYLCLIFKMYRDHRLQRRMSVRSRRDGSVL